MPAITSRNRILVVCLLAVAVLALQPAGALGGNSNPGIHPPTSNPYGLSYTEWSVRWWQWALSIPASQNPLLDPDGTFCHVGQSGHVFFLGSNGGGANVRSCAIDTGQSVLFVAGGAICIVPRPLGLFEIRIFIPLSDEISIESTVDSSRMSMSFLT